MKKKFKAFTLAEILIALTIVGVIAAITTPIILNSSYKKENPTKLKKFFLTMSQAVNQSEQEGDKYATEWTYSSDTETFYKKYLKPYLTGGIKPEGGYFLDDGSNYDIEYNSSADCMEVIYDLNGTHKPNAYGVDKFAFLICSNSSAKANRLAGFDTYNLSGAPNISRTDLIDKCSSDGDDAKYCSRLLQLDGWEYKSDYPWAE